MPDTGSKQYSIEQVAAIVEAEGLGYAVQNHTSADRIADEDLARLWRIAKEALDGIAVILEDGEEPDTDDDDDTAAGEWQVVFATSSGFVHDDTETGLRETFDDKEDGKIVICRGSALPQEAEGGGLRLPDGVYNTSDVFAEFDLVNADTYEDGVELLRRAWAAADGLNSMTN